MLEHGDNVNYQLLKNDDIEAFNEAREKGVEVDIKDANFRAFNLKGANLNGLDLSDSYFKNTDLRGVDLRSCNLSGCCFLNAKVSGVFFPNNISAAELNLSITSGTRIRLDN